VLSLQRHIAAEIAAHAQVLLTPSQRTRLNKVQPLDPAAYDGYLQGRYLDQPFSSLALPIAKNVSECRIERNLVLRRLGFDLTDAPIDDTLQNSDNPSLEANVLQRIARTSLTLSPVHIATMHIVLYGSCSTDIRS
jgi:hypothetical protein